MELIGLEKPQKPIDGNTIFGTPIPPIERLKLFSDSQFEDMINEWANDYLRSKYCKIFRIGGAGDKGRDIVAYIDEVGDKFDIYQCKLYGSVLSPSDYWVEFGKLCHYTYNGDYKIPQNYYIVASQGVGPKLRDFISEPTKISEELKNVWDTYCKNGITKTGGICLEGEFETYVSKFDFSIVKVKEPLELIDEYSTTKWFKYRFGGGLKPRPKPTKPSKELDEDEKKLPYVTELINVYSEHTSGKVTSLEVLNSNIILFDHFTRQREDFHSAQSLKRFSRDELIDEEPYNEIKEEIFKSVIDVSRNSFTDGYERVNETLREARKVNIEGSELRKVLPSDKCGMCHELVNDKKLKWVISYD